MYKRGEHTISDEERLWLWMHFFSARLQSGIDNSGTCCDVWQGETFGPINRADSLVPGSSGTVHCREGGDFNGGRHVASQEAARTELIYALRHLAWLRAEQSPKCRHYVSAAGRRPLPEWAAQDHCSQAVSSRWRMFRAYLRQRNGRLPDAKMGSKGMLSVQSLLPPPSHTVSGAATINTRTGGSPIALACRGSAQPCP